MSKHDPMNAAPTPGVQVIDSKGHIFVEHEDCGWIRWRPSTRSWVTGWSWDAIADRGPVRVNPKPVPTPVGAVR